MEENIVSQENEMDEVLKSVSDEIIAKKRKRRKISFSIISLFVLALAVAIITLSCVQIDLKPYFIVNPDHIEITINNQSVPTSFFDDDEDYNNVIKAFDGSFITNCLSGIFTGKLGDYKVEQENHKFYYSFSDSTGTGMNSSLKSSLGSNYVRFHYNNAQTLYNSNKKEFTPTDTTLKYKIEYVDVYFDLSTSASDETTTFYFGAIGDRANSTFSITVEANTFELYEYVLSI